MKKRTLLFALIALPFIVNSQDVLRIKNGETLTVTENIEIAEFVMENNSTIILKGMTDWSLHANVSYIGENCRILGNGSTGRTGKNGVDHTGRAGKCKTGAVGRPGETGGSGTNGVNIDVKTSFVTLGNLIIESRGGQGGQGGNGGKGQRGGAIRYDRFGFKECGGGHGGDGGRAGTGGVGGNGGNVNIRYIRTSNKGVIPQYSNDALIKKDIVQIYNSRGNNGPSGKGGPGGPPWPGKAPGREGFAAIPQSASGKDGSINFNEYTLDCYEKEAYETYALIISISDYGDEPTFWEGIKDKLRIKKIKKTEEEWVEDAKMLKETLDNNYQFEHIEHLINPTGLEFTEHMLDYMRKGEQKNVVIFLSGHGNYDGSKDLYQFMLNDSDFETFDNLQNQVVNSKVKNLLLVFNACFSGKILDSETIDISNPTENTLKTAELYCNLPGKHIITAGFEDELVDDKMMRYMIQVLENNEKDYLSAEDLFYELTGRNMYDYEGHRPSIGRVYNSGAGQFIFYKKK